MKPDDIDRSEYAGLLSPEHRELLAQSVITPDVANARRYLEVSEVAQLTHSGYAPSQRQPHMIPGLLVPLWSVSGKMEGSQYRPDEPRENDEGRAIKYETPRKMPMRLDVHPFTAPKLGNPKVPLVATEGARKGDAIVSAGWCAIALLGVWNWRGRNRDGGFTALADWEHVAFKGDDGPRRVFVAFDSDVMLNPAVHEALTRFGRFLAGRGADVGYVYLPAGKHGAKVGVDDWLAAGNDIATLPHLARPEPLPAMPEPTPQRPERPDVPVQDGAALLGWLVNVFRYYVVLPSEHAYLALALWVLHTHCIDVLDLTPRLLITGATRGVGKTRVLEVAAPLCFETIAQSSASAAYLFRRIDQGIATILLDECDSVFGDRENEPLRNLLNSGWARGFKVGRVNPSTMDLEEFDAFAPVMLAGIGHAAVPDTVRDRAIVITMRKRRPDEPIHRLQRRVWVEQAAEYRDCLAAWAYDNGEKLRALHPQPLDGLPDRAWDKWEPLVAIADLAGSEWGQAARDAARALTKAEGALASAALVTPLAILEDTRRIFTQPRLDGGDPPDTLTPTQLASTLNSLLDSGWHEERNGQGISPNRVSKLLREFEIVAVLKRDGKRVERQYRPDMFADAWARNLEPLGDSDA